MNIIFIPLLGRATRLDHNCKFDCEDTFLSDEKEIYLLSMKSTVSKQQNCLHVWKFWIVHLIGNLIYKIIRIYEEWSIIQLSCKKRI